MLRREIVLGVPVDVGTMDDTVREIFSRVNRGQVVQHVVVNAAKIVNMQNDGSLRDSVVSADIINIDGMGVVFAARVLGLSIPERVAGIDLFDRLIFECETQKIPVFFLGATDQVLKLAISNVCDKHKNLIVAGYNNGYFWEDEERIVSMVRDSGAKFLFVAITSPYKENFINKWKSNLGVDFIMGVGGTFDVMAGKVKRAPLWMQNYGLEWLYRVIQEPGRMWKRYLVTNTKFVLMLVSAKFKQSFPLFLPKK